MKKSASTKAGRYLWQHLVLLAFAILIVYGKVLHAGFISWDDLDYVQHPDVTNGISAKTIRHWFTQYYLGNYQPLVMATYAFDYSIGGSDPHVFHVHNLFWHLAATMLAYFFVCILHGDRRVALFVALLFAIHPVQTESVSWIAARNKSMNAAFYLAAMCLYVSYSKTKGTLILVLATGCGVLAYICKSTALALPLALFAVDIWMRRPLNDWRIWAEKLPLVAAGIPVAIMTLNAQHEVQFLEHHHLDAWSRIVFAGYAWVTYVTHLILPLKLSVVYPFPKALTYLHSICFIIAIAGLIAMIVAYRRRRFMWAGGLLFFTVNLLPVLQLVQFGETLMADRYLYIAGIGIWLPLVGEVFSGRDKRVASSSTAIATSVCVIFMALTFSRNSIWLSEKNFWNSILDKFPESTTAHYSIGAALMKSGDLAAAGRHMGLAVQYDPDNAKAWFNQGSLMMRQGNISGALDAVNKSIALQPGAKAYFMRAMIHLGMRRYALAIEDVDKVLMEQPANARAYCIKADCEDHLGMLADAMKHYDQAITCDDREPLFFIRRGMLEAKTGRKQAAYSDLDQAVALKPGDGESLYYRAVVHYLFGQSPCDDLNHALQYGYSQATGLRGEACK